MSEPTETTEALPEETPTTPLNVMPEAPQEDEPAPLQEEPKRGRARAAAPKAPPEETPTAPPVPNEAPPEEPKEPTLTETESARIRRASTASLSSFLETKADLQPHYRAAIVEELKARDALRQKAEARPQLIDRLRVDEEALIWSADGFPCRLPKGSLVEGDTARKLAEQGIHLTPVKAKIVYDQLNIPSLVEVKA